jgi:hypothetical protein
MKVVKKYNTGGLARTKKEARDTFKAEKKSAKAYKKLARKDRRDGLVSKEEAKEMKAEANAAIKKARDKKRSDIKRIKTSKKKLNKIPALK